MKYTYQEISDSGNFALPSPMDVSHARNKRQLRLALERWADVNGQYNDERDASLIVWKGELDDVTDIYPEFEMRVGPRGGAIFNPC